MSVTVVPVITSSDGIVSSGGAPEIVVGGVVYGEGVYPPDHPAASALDPNEDSFLRMRVGMIIG